VEANLVPEGDEYDYLKKFGPRHLIRYLRSSETTMLITFVTKDVKAEHLAMG
jgi:hypothetical protein